MSVYGESFVVPTVGDVVLYRTDGGAYLPAIVVRQHDDGPLDLSVQGRNSQGAELVRRVRFDPWSDAPAGSWVHRGGVHELGVDPEPSHGVFGAPEYAETA